MIPGMRNSIICCVVIATLCFAGTAQNQKTPSDDSGRLLSLESMWNEAEVKHDARALSLLLADEFAYTDEDGSFRNREQWLSHVAQEVDQYEQLGNTSLAVHLHGDVAIVTGEYREKLKIKGKSQVHRGRFTDTWIRQNEQWKCAASQSTLIEPQHVPLRASQ